MRPGQPQHGWALYFGVGADFADHAATGDTGADQRLPARGVRFVGAVREEARPQTVTMLAPREVATKQPKPEPILPDKPSIAALPFSNLSGEEDYFRRHVEKIVTALSRCAWLFVIALSGPTETQCEGSMAVLKSPDS
jgi:hypothetical protein